MGISDRTIQAVKDRVEIEEVVSDFVSLKRKGKDMWACCPFHEEKTPSFSIAPEKGFYKCFGCGVSGDSITFIMEIEGLSYPEAIRHLANKYGIPVEETSSTPEQDPAQQERESLMIVLSHASEFFQKQLWETEEGRSIGLTYLKERGYHEQIIRDFNLGYSPDAWDALLKEALKKGFSEEMLEKAGLIIKKEDKRYDRFRHRVIFPIQNVSGKVIAFGGRVLQKNTRQAKYINSPETEVYHKSKVLYGIYQARQEIRKADNCYLVEGYTDVISLHLAAIPNVVASSGTSLTVDQIKLIKRYTTNITVLFDGDLAGIKASLRGIDLLLEQGLNVKAVRFEEGEDPDSYSRKIGSQAFREFLEKNAKDFLIFKLELMAEEAEQDPMAKAEAIRDILFSISRIPDAVARTLFIKETSKNLNIGEETLISELNKIVLKDRSSSKRQESILLNEHINQVQETQTDLESTIAIKEAEIIRLLLTYPGKEVSEGLKVHEFILNELEELEFSIPIHVEIVSDFEKQLSEGNIADDRYFIQEGSPEIQVYVIDLVTFRYILSPLWTEKFGIHVPKEEDDVYRVVYNSLLQLKFYSVKKLIRENKIHLEDTIDPQTQLKYIRIHKELKKHEMEIAGMLGNVIS